MNTDSQPLQAAEGALRKTADSVNALADKVQETVKQTQERLNQLQQDVKDRTRSAAESTDTYVRENPWNAVAAAAAVGFIVGVVLGRR